MRHRSAEQAFIQREGKHILRRLGRDTAIAQAFQQRLQPRSRGGGTAPTKPGVQSFRRRRPIAKPCGKGSEGRLITAEGDTRIKLCCLLHFLKGIQGRLQRRSIGGLGTLRESHQRRRAMGFAPSEQGSEWRKITRLPLPERPKSRAAQSIALAQCFARSLPGKRGVKR